MYVYKEQIMDNKIQKDQKTPTAASEELGARTRYCACLQHTIPPEGWVPPKPPLQLNPWTPRPYLPHIRNQLASLCYWEMDK